MAAVLGLADEPIRARHGRLLIFHQTKTMSTLEAIRSAAQEKLPNVTIEHHPYDIGYWACCAGLDVPRRLKIEGSDLGEFRAGWAQADSDE